MEVFHTDLGRPKPGWFIPHVGFLLNSLLLTGNFNCLSCCLPGCVLLTLALILSTGVLFAFTLVGCVLEPRTKPFPEAGILL